ncbi:hypothetical protein P7K49_030337 [Saguinus oedipus]|uniref:Uncharacterized protein n=1 Tax=Saguinus oedipus TaxID=9490 RepID=A0ABQ9U1W7_SAGOE|nr:hypothetical protein P7K49_030337 [Saguinus oedipus]
MGSALPPRLAEWASLRTVTFLFQSLKAFAALGMKPPALSPDSFRPGAPSAPSLRAVFASSLPGGPPATSSLSQHQSSTALDNTWDGKFTVEEDYYPRNPFASGGRAPPLPTPSVRRRLSMRNRDCACAKDGTGEDCNSRQAEAGLGSRLSQPLEQLREWSGGWRVPAAMEAVPRMPMIWLDLKEAGDFHFQPAVKKVSLPSISPPPIRRVSPSSASA